MKHHLPIWEWFVACLPIFTGFLAGCAGNVRCNFVSQNMESIRVEPTDARSFELDATECYWWVDDQKQLNIAGQGRLKSLLGKQYDREFAIFFKPGQPSQGVGKDYRLLRDTVQGYIQVGANLHRFESTYGLLGTENRPGEHLVAAYRCGIRIQSAKLFGGWSSGVPFLIYGTMEAVPNQEGKGQAIQEKINQNQDE
jgi:hypothetical protein